jgi:tetratricopeptide (TPR) repeat protein
VYYDGGQGREAGDKAIAMADSLGRELEELELRGQRESLNQELHDLLMQVALAETRAKPGAMAVPRILDRLERAAALRTPSQSYHRLRARCYRAVGAVGDEARAEAEEGKAEAAAATPLDHFLRAEELHAGALESAAALEGDVMWLPDRELLREAVAEYRLALRGDPGNFWYHRRLGLCYLALNQGEDALEEMGTCVALKPDVAWVRGTRGLMLGLMGRYADGEADLERAREIDKEFRPAVLDRGLLAWLQGKDGQALEDFAAVLEPPANRRLIAAAYYRGLLYLGQREYRKALEDFEAVVKENPEFRPVYLVRAQAHFLNKDADNGLADYRVFLDKARAKKFEPTDPALPALRGRLLLQLVPKWGLPKDETGAMLELARGQMKEALKKGHSTADLFADLGSVADLLGKSDEAIAFYEEALKRRPAPALAVKLRTQRGWIYAQHPDGPDPVRANADFGKAVELDTTHGDAHAGLGYVAAKRGLTGPAHREAFLAEFHAGDNYAVLHNVACVYAELSLIEKGQEEKDRDAAMELLRRGDRLCRKGGEGNKAIDMMKGEESFKVLHDREDWKKLVGE